MSQCYCGNVQSIYLCFGRIIIEKSLKRTNLKEVKWRRYIIRNCILVVFLCKKLYDKMYFVNEVNLNYDYIV